MADLPFAEHDVFRGWTAEDIPFVQALVEKRVDPVPGVYTDSVGVRVLPSYCPWIADRLGIVDTSLPLPDSYLADGIEYACLAHAIKHIGAGMQRRLVVGEIGAGWGPWVSAAAVLGRRMGADEVSIVALEADAARFQMLRQHLDVNDVVPLGAPSVGASHDVTWRLLQAACAAQDGVLYWPNTGNIHDAGMKAVERNDVTADYRGLNTQFIEVPAVSMATAFEGLGYIDFLHIDIQGSEAELIASSLDFLNERVRWLFVGTHSRAIEGAIIDTLFRKGWSLIREKPCQFMSNSPAPTLIGQTFKDGAQFWNNYQLA